MKIKPASWIQNIKPSATMALNTKATNMKNKGIDVISLVVGEPDFNTPTDVKEALKNSVNNNFTKYTSATGILELREAISKKLNKQNSLDYSAKQIVVSNGAKQALNMAISIILEEGDELFIPTPYWVSYIYMATLAHSKANIVKTSIDTNYKVTPELLEQNYTNKTRAILLNNPSNPTGAVYTREELMQIVDWCYEHNVVIISDEVYERITFNTDFVSTASVSKKAYEITLTVNGLSKSHAMTGWRVGFVAGPQNIIDAISSFQGHFSSHIPSFVQEAAITAFNNYKPVTQMVESYQKRVELAFNLLKSLLPKAKLIKPSGAFYLFPDFSYYFDKLNMTDIEFCEQILEIQHVAIVPGSAFGEKNNIRISVATSEDLIKKGITKIADFISKN